MTVRRTARPSRGTGDTTGETAGGDTGDLPGLATEQDVQSADEEIAELGTQLPEGAMLTLWRFLDGDEKEFLSDQPVAGFTIASVAARFGGGRYICFMRKPNPAVAGNYFKAGSKRFQIGGPPRFNVPDAAAPASAANAEDMKRQQTFAELVQQNIRAATEQAQLTSNMQLALLKSMTERAPDPFVELMKTLLPTVLPKLLDRGGSTSIADVIALADRMAAKTSPSSQFKDTLEMMKAARELTGDDPAPPWMTLAARGLDVIGRAVTGTPPQLAPGEPIATPPPPAGEVAPVLDVPPFVKWLAPQIPALIRHANLDHDPDTYAGVMVDAIEPENFRDVLEYLKRPMLLSELAVVFPGVVPVESWFAELRDRVIERLEEELTPQPVADDPPTPPTT